MYNDGFSRHRIVAVVTIVLILFVLLIASIPPAKARFVLIEPNKEFFPSAATYSNLTMPFDIGDVYGGYSYWTLAGGGSQGFDSIDDYITDCDGTPKEFEFFGFDEFVNHSFIYAETNFKPITGAGQTFDFVPLGYFYQKTALDDYKHWALAVTLDEVGFGFVYNTGNGNTPTNITLAAYPIPFDQGDRFDISLENAGDGETSVYINRTTSPVGLIYNGSIQTGNYDARVLYAGFGDVAYTGVNVWGFWEYLTIRDTILTISSGGTGFSKIDAYLDEKFAQTLYDLDEGGIPVLDIYATTTNITLLVDCWLNSTAFGISTILDGENIIRHSITVTATNNTVVFSQTNLTYVSGIDYGDNVFLYQYSIQLGFTPILGNIYTVVLTYEIFS